MLKILIAVMSFSIIPFIAVSNDGTKTSLIFPATEEGNGGLAVDLGDAAKSVVVKRDGTLLDANDAMDGIRLAGSQIIAYAHGHSSNSPSVGSNFANTVQYFSMVNVPENVTATGIGFFQTVQGNYTPSNYNGVGLYSYDGAGTLTLIASSADDPDLWKQPANTLKKQPFTAPIVLQPGLYWLSFLYCRSAAVTDPQIAFGAAVVSSQLSSLDLGSNAKTYGLGSVETALETSIVFSSIGNDNGRPWLFLY